jgi:CRP-like cAMP-binding protein
MYVQSSKRTFVKNTILASLSSPCFAAIAPFLEPVGLKRGVSLQEPKKPVQHIYFIESGIVSLRAVAAGSFVEIAIIGYRGAVGVWCLLGGHLPTHSTVLFPGRALRIHVDEFRRAVREQPEISCHLLRFVPGLITHGAQAALCGIRHELEQRLASWLCLASDAVDGDVLPITHDDLSTALGLRRPGVTETLARFEQGGLVRKTRGVIQVVDRKLLEQRACSCCGIIASAYSSAEPLSCIGQ